MEKKSLHLAQFSPLNVTAAREVLTQLADASHPRGEERLFHRAEFGRSAAAVTFATPARAPLLIPVEVQTLG